MSTITSEVNINSRHISHHNFQPESVIVSSLSKPHQFASLALQYILQKDTKRSLLVSRNQECQTGELTASQPPHQPPLVCMLRLYMPSWCVSRRRVRSQTQAINQPLLFLANFPQQHVAKSPPSLTLGAPVSCCCFRNSG